MNRSRRQMQGFTLLKRAPRGHGMHWILSAMLAMTVSALLVGMVAVAVAAPFACGSKASTTRRDIATVLDVLRLYRLGHGQYPQSLDALVSAGLLDRAPYDAWGNAFAYSVDGH